MQALILAAGMGKRLKELTNNNTKCMVDVAGIKLIDRAIKSIKTAGITRIILVVGYAADNLIQYIGEKYKDDKDVEFVFVKNKDYAKTNNIYSLYLARELFSSDDTILIESDLIFEENLIKMVFDETNQNLAVVAKFQTWMDGTVVNVLENNTISQFIEKKDFDILKTDIYYKTVNIYKFSKKFIKNEYVPFLKAFMQAYGKNEYYETALKIIVHLYRTPLKAFILDEQKWYEIDNKQDWEIATELFKND